jgi:hypothetical protein
MMANTNSKLSFAISYGLAGGPANARKLCRLLSQAGYSPARQLDEADIIIAHSGGCWMIPANAKPRLLIYVGLPLAQNNPSKTWAAYHASRFKQADILQILWGRAIGCYYILRQPLRNFSMIRLAKTAQPVIFDQAVTVFITNQDDPWLKDAKLQTYVDNCPWAFVGLPGTHDYIWEQSADYVSIINHYARLLA